MQITTEMIKDLRERTGAGVLDCKKMLAQTNGDMEAAVVELQKKGLAKAAKKAGRIAAEGMVHSYIHSGGRIGVLVEVNCETDFVARNEEFRTFVDDVAMQIAAMSPLYVKAEDIPKDDMDRQREIFVAQAKESGKPQNVAEKMVEGRLKKWAKEVCLYDQDFVRDTEKKTTVNDIRGALVAKIGEKIEVRRFVRFEVGEGIEKRKHDLAAEVAEQLAMTPQQ